MINVISQSQFNLLQPGLWSRYSNFRLQLRASKFFDSVSNN